MKQNIWCKIFKLHKYEILKEVDKVDARGNIIGTIIISRCTNCGKIKEDVIYTEDNHGIY